MSLNQVLEAINTLKSYPAISEYIKNFDGNHGFMYTVETEPEKIQIKAQMEQVLDDGSHTGASWGWMMRTIQAFLSGVITYEDIVKQQEEENQQYQYYMERARVRLQEQQQEPPAQEQEQQAQEQEPQVQVQEPEAQAQTQVTN